MSNPTNPPRENLVRALSEPAELTRDNDAELLRGHFAVWDTWTEINSVYEGHFLERFAPGAMSKTMTEGRGRMKVLFQHGKDPQIGDKPLGTIERLEPDETGAYYEVRMFDTNYNSELLPGLKAGVYGASHRFKVVSEEFDKKPKRSEHNPNGIPERTVTEARVFEFGPVTFGAYPTATSGVRSMTDEFIFGRYLEDPEMLEQMLARQRELRQPRVTVTYGSKVEDAIFVGDPDSTISETKAFADHFAEHHSEPRAVEPELPEATTPPETPVEPEPSEATTRATGETTIQPLSREEFLAWLSRSRT